METILTILVIFFVIFLVGKFGYKQKPGKTENGCDEYPKGPNVPPPRDD